MCVMVLMMMLFYCKIDLILLEGKFCRRLDCMFSVNKGACFYTSIISMSTACFHIVNRKSVAIFGEGLDLWQSELHGG